MFHLFLPFSLGSSCVEEGFLLHWSRADFGSVVVPGDSVQKWEKRVQEKIHCVVCNSASKVPCRNILSKSSGNFETKLCSVIVLKVHRIADSDKTGLCRQT